MEDTINFKRGLRDIVLPNIIMILTTALVFIGFYLIKSLSGDLICNISVVGGEETDPTLGRLIVCLSYLFFSVLMISVAEKIWKANEEKILLSWTMAAFGGTLLWTSVGECSWHFGLQVLSDEGVELFTNFPRIECIQGIPFFILSIMIFVTCFKKFSFPFASYLLSFIGNWYGHLCMIAAYPIARALGCKMELESFYKVSALGNAVVLAVIALYMIFGKTKRTTKYLAAICMYVALGNVLFGIVMGET